ncbi:hypothetical protein UPYG_G00243650 [Umbra pygmaea]|uniref:Ig-like domain-containing protein n=1 Tax=Umbra pygmaea TaxID=75934 RepID=A0ABD0X016_UMBPY
MNLVTSWLFLVIHFVFISAPEQFISLDCKNENHGVHGQRSLLECIVKSVVPISIRDLIWNRVREDGMEFLFEYFEGETFTTPGFTLAEPDWNNRNLNVSLLLTNTKMEDEGEYECDVLTDRGTATLRVSLKVTAKYTSPVMSSIPKNNIKENQPVNIFCNSTGQKGMIWWFNKLGQNCTHDAELETKENNDGLFSLSSKLTVQKATSNNSIYTCNFLSTTGFQKETASFQLQFDRSSMERRPDEAPYNVPITNWLVPIVVIGSLIAGFVVALLCRKKCFPQRKKSKKQVNGSSDVLL